MHKSFIHYYINFLLGSALMVTVFAVIDKNLYELYLGLLFSIGCILVIREFRKK